MVKVEEGEHALTHCAVVDGDEQVIFDRYIKPKEKNNQLHDVVIIVFFEEWNANSSVFPNLFFNFYHYNRYSGVEPAHLQGGEVLPHDNAVQVIRSLLMGKIVVGHDIINDFRAIEYTCPECDI